VTVVIHLEELQAVTAFSRQQILAGRVVVRSVFELGLIHNALSGAFERGLVVLAFEHRVSASGDS